VELARRKGREERRKGSSKKDRKKKDEREETNNDPPLIISSTIQRLLNSPSSILLHLTPDLPSEVLVEPTISIHQGRVDLLIGSSLDLGSDLHGVMANVNSITRGGLTR
jgi:hypothetical protein